MLNKPSLPNTVGFRVGVLAAHVAADRHKAPVSRTPPCTVAPGTTSSVQPEPELHRGPATRALYEHLEREGYCVVPDILTTAMVKRLRAATDLMIDAELGSDGPFSSRQLFRSQGSMIAVPGHRAAAQSLDSDKNRGVNTPGAVLDPVFGELITWTPALESLVQMGWPAGAATFTDGYIISKPPHSPPLFWHYDWFSWEIDVDYAPEPPQLFFMYYLHDTSVSNGCLRVLPRTHYTHHALHEQLENPHNAEYSRADDPTSFQYATRCDEVNVMVRAGDLVMGDSRLLHAAHANQSDFRRTVITLWIQPDFPRLPLKTQAQMLLKTHRVPEEWAEIQQAELLAMLPQHHWNEAGHNAVEDVVAREKLDVSRQLYSRQGDPTVH